MWSDFYTHWKYIVGLLVYSILLALPIYNNISTLASSITNTTNQVLHMAYLYYAINTLWNGYFLYESVDPVYLLFYFALIIVYGIWNPYHLLTTVIPMTYTFFLTLLLMIVLNLFKKDFLATLFVFLLTITSQMALYSFSFKPTFLLLGVMALYLIGYYFYFQDTTITVPTGALNPITDTLALGQTIGQRVNDLTTITKSGIFVLVAGSILYLYVRTISKNYYGGELLLNDPISLNQHTSFTIEPTYHSSLSCWFYLTPSTKTGYNTVMLYGNQLLVSYEANLNSLRVRLKDNISYIETKVLLQKWNHFAFIYDHGKIVLFLNGEVIHTSEWSPSSFTNELLFGSVQGEIAHVRYYKEAVDARFLESLYEDFKQKNPPIV
jgi:hypothetical protein